MKKILVVDDEIEIIELLKLYLETEKCIVHEAFDGMKALEKLEDNDYDMVIVDIIMPNINGFELIKKIREEKNMPILVISACIDSSDKIFGLELGADDYVTKPFDPMEVAARVKVLFRRIQDIEGRKAIEKSTEEEFVEVNHLILHLHSCKVTNKNNETFDLSATEFRVLKNFMENPGRVFTKDQIYQFGWKDCFVDDNRLRVLMSKLREKIGPENIKTIRGLGYRMERSNEKA
ncbi:response regulator transcription factor [Enterococcus sp. DIV0187]|uniref:response regulator transcription factor n=1 Tax=Enterococcus sp. DIV0187 TaxID=2774644 RepID=UPI003F26A080